MPKDRQEKPMIVGYSGHTHIAIRPGIDSSLNASTQALGFNKLLDLNEFRGFAKNGSFFKPVVNMIVDGGQEPLLSKGSLYCLW